MKHGQLESYVARKLEAYPFFAPVVRLPYRWYRRLCVACHNKGFTAEIHPGAAITGVLRPDAKNREAFFGYYDKTPWSWDSRYYLVHLFDRRYQDKMAIAVYDRDSTGLRILDYTQSFNFQQGAMLRWLNSQDYRIIYNAVEDGRLIARITDAASGDRIKDIPMPIQTVNSQGTEALTLNYKRLDKIRPEYGYRADVMNFHHDMSYEEDGIWRLDLTTGESDLIISLAQLIDMSPQESMRGARHKINHIMYSPLDRRFVFMHRWLKGRKKLSRLYTADGDGSEICCLADDGLVSHYCWVDEHWLVAWMRKKPLGDRYFLLKDRSAQFSVLGDGVLDELGDGHPSIHPNKEWLVTDTYPDRSRIRQLVLFNLRTGKKVVVGRFFAPWRYDGPYRCDLHPRWGPDGTRVSMDSAHEGFRNTYVVDVSGVLAGSG